MTIRWQGSEIQDDSPVNFSVTLFSNGSIRFDYGDGNANLSPTVGLSIGINNIVRLSHYDGQTSLTDADSVQFNLVHSYDDIGAYEFQGNSNDLTSPIVMSTTPAAIDSDSSASV